MLSSAHTRHVLVFHLRYFSIVSLLTHVVDVLSNCIVFLFCFLASCDMSTTLRHLVNQQVVNES